jgi:hypothetical protein
MKKVEERGLKLFYCHCPGGTCTIGSPALGLKTFCAVLCERHPYLQEKITLLFINQLCWHFWRPKKPQQNRKKQPNNEFDKWSLLKLFYVILFSKGFLIRPIIAIRMPPPTPPPRRLPITEAMPTPPVVVPTPKSSQ